MDQVPDFTATINGLPVHGRSSMSVINPATEAVVAQAPDCDEAQLNDAVAAARAAFPKWQATPLSQRQALVHALGARIAEHKDMLMRLLTAEQGKPHADAMGDVMGGVQWCTSYAGMDLPVLVTEDSPARRTSARRH